MRLNRFLSYAGFGARRKVEEIVRQGRVTVNGVEVLKPSIEVDPTRDVIRVDGERVRLPKKFVYIMFNKPQAVLTAMEKEKGDRRVTVGDYFRNYPVRVFPVGRLDYNSEGLLLMTNDGELAERLMHPKYHIPKVYMVKVRGTLTEKEIEKMKRGVKLEDGFFKPLSFKIVGKSRTGRNTYIRITIDVGRNRIIRRFFERLKHPVMKLKRIAIGPIKLGDLPRGRFRELTEKEVEMLKEITGLKEGR